MERRTVTICFFFTLMWNVNCYNIFSKADDGSFYVIDGVFAKSKNVLEKTLSSFGSTNWKFTVDEILHSNETKPLRLGFKTKSKGDLKVLKVHGILQKLISKTLGCPTVFPTNLQGRIIERGDFSPVVAKCFGNTSRLISIITLSKKWKKNDYGEMTIYDENGDVIRSFYPKFGRVALIKCGVPFKISPPSINVARRHYFLITEFGHEKIQDAEADFKEEPSLSEFFNRKYKADDNPLPDIVPENYITRKFFTNQGRKMFVYDNAVPLQFVDILHEYIRNHADYYESPIFEKDSADNVKWVISLDDPGFVDGPIWNVIKQLLVHIGGKDFFPYDLACNHVRRTDNTHDHKDNYDDADEYTVLIYLNKDWKDDHYGETTFLENGEIVAGLRPRYGRVVIFHGTIDHSAHPASPEVHGARYTFAIKTAASKELAISRILAQEGGLEYSKVMSKLSALEANGKPKEKGFAKKAIMQLQSGRLPGENFIQKLIDMFGATK